MNPGRPTSLDACHGGASHGLRRPASAGGWMHVPRLNFPLHVLLPDRTPHILQHGYQNPQFAPGQGLSLDRQPCATSAMRRPARPRQAAPRPTAGIRCRCRPVRTGCTAAPAPRPCGPCVAAPQPGGAADDVRQQRSGGRQQDREREQLHQRMAVVGQHQHRGQRAAGERRRTRAAARIQACEAFGISPSRAAAKGTCAEINTQPFNAPKHDTVATSAMPMPAAGPPQTARGIGHRRLRRLDHVGRQQAEHRGAGEDRGEPAEQRAEHGGARDGAPASRIAPAGIVAASGPRKPHSVNATVACTAFGSDSPLGLNGV